MSLNHKQVIAPSPPPSAQPQQPPHNPYDNQRPWHSSHAPPPQLKPSLQRAVLGKDTLASCNIYRNMMIGIKNLNRKKKKNISCRSLKKVSWESWWDEGRSSNSSGSIPHTKGPLWWHFHRILQGSSLPFVIIMTRGVYDPVWTG